MASSEHRPPPTDLGCAMVAKDELVAIFSPADPRSRSSRIAIADLAAVALVSREQGSGTRLAWERAVARAGSKLVDPAVVLDNTAAIRSAVHSGVAPAVLSSLVVADDVRLGRVSQVRLDPAVIRPITAIWRGGERDLAVYAAVTR